MTKKTVKQTIGIIIVIEIIASMLGLVSLTICGSFMRGFVVSNVTGGVIILVILLCALLKWLFEE